MLPTLIGVFPLLAGLVAAKKCMNTTVPITVSARTGVFDLPIPHNNLEVTAFIQNATRQGYNYSDAALTGYTTTSGTYNISTQFCMPDRGMSNNPTVQILTHGIGFDRTYWDASFNNFNYSYVNVATDKYDYCTLTYDRLGIGSSSHGDPLNEIQTSLEIAVLAELATMLRRGTLLGVDHAFNKVLHFGHSYGSIQAVALVAADPTIFDGMALTGFSINSTYLNNFEIGSHFVLANANQPFRLGNATIGQLQTLLESTPYGYGLTDYLAGLATSAPGLKYPDGYFAILDADSNQYNFLLPGRFDANLLYFGDATKSPTTMGELLTLLVPPAVTEYANPVIVMTGARDLPFCGGDCTSTGDPSVPNIPSLAQKLFPKVPQEDYETYLQPDTAHGLTFHYNQTAGFDVLNDFFNQKGLGST